MSTALVTQDRPRAPGFVNAALVLTLSIVVGLVALNVRQPPPPAIAEFAPQAAEQIKDAPSEQSSAFGSGEGGECPPEAPECALGLDATGLGLSKTLPPIDVPRVRKCVGDPPRQIEDPQSPPCVPYWEGDNGGSTWQGVTRDEIIIALPHTIDGQNEQTLERPWKALQAFFNKRFEFYGRKLRLIPFFANVHRTNNTQPALYQSKAVFVDEETKAFASLRYPDTGGAEIYYYDELARRGVVSVAHFPPTVREDHFEEFAPYQWSTIPGIDVIGRNLGEWACNQLAGKTASYAGGPERLQQRVFGLVVSTWDHGFGKPDVSSIEAGLSSCGVTPAITIYRRVEDVNSPNAHANARTAMLDLRNAGVTSVLCLCYNGPIWLEDWPAATNEGYFPEWLVATAWAWHPDVDAQTVAPKDHMEHTFGLEFYNKSVTTAELPLTWAISEVDPTFQWGPQGANSDTAAHARTWQDYGSILLLASGIQMAGPNLTPKTFEQGLLKAKWPNPGCGGPPFYQSCVRFGPNDHSMHGDAANVWWSTSAQSTWGRPGGAWCYADRGLRFGIGRWPKKDPAVFSGSCY